MRIMYHSVFNEAIIEINSILNPLISFIDGAYGLANNGPMDGISFPFNLILFSLQIMSLMLMKL